MAGDRRRLRGAERRPLKGYAPLVVLVAALVVMVAVVPSKVPAELAVDRAGRRHRGRRRASRRPGWNETVTACPDRQLQVPDLGVLAALLRLLGRQRRRDRPGRHRRHHQGDATG